MARGSWRVLRVGSWTVVALLLMGSAAAIDLNNPWGSCALALGPCEEPDWRTLGGGEVQDVHRVIAVGEQVVTLERTGPGLESMVRVAAYAAADGDLLWRTDPFAGAGYYLAVDLTEADTADSVLVLGKRAPNGDGALARILLADGSVDWVRFLDDAFAASVEPWDLVDGAACGLAFLTGASHVAEPAFPTRDIAVLAFDAATGISAWNTIVGTDEPDIFPIAAAWPGADAKVVVASRQQVNSDGSTSAVVQALDACLGTSQWTTVLPEGGLVTALSADDVGNIYLSDWGETGLVVSMDGATGSVRWQQSEAQFVSYLVQDLAVDPAVGVVVVTGPAHDLLPTLGAFSPGSAASWDVVTTAYALSDGARLWQNRYDGSMGLGDRGHALAIDPSGDIFVSGVTNDHYYCFGAGPATNDMLLLRLRGTDGGLASSTTWDGPGHRDEWTSTIALGDDLVVMGGRTMMAAGVVTPDCSGSGAASQAAVVAFSTA